MELPAVTVEYRQLRVETEALVGSASIPTVVSVPLTAAKVRRRGRESRMPAEGLQRGCRGAVAGVQKGCGGAVESLAALCDVVCQAVDVGSGTSEPGPGARGTGSFTFQPVLLPDQLYAPVSGLLFTSSFPCPLSSPQAQKLLHLHNEREAKPLAILNDLQGRLVPGRLTLLLGPPSCGKSSFMRALTGRLMPAQGRVRRGAEGGAVGAVVGVGCERGGRRERRTGAPPGGGEGRKRRACVTGVRFG